MGCNCGKKKKDIRYFSTEDQKRFARDGSLPVRVAKVRDPESPKEN